MDNTIFIADQDSRCGEKIADKLIINDFRIIKTFVSKNSLKEKEENNGDQKNIKLDWNCFSTISPKNVILKARQFKDFTSAAIIYTSPETTTPFISKSYIEIQKSIDYYFRSLVTMTKEIIDFLSKKSDANLYLILNNGNKDEVYYTIYRSFINSVLETSSDNLKIYGIENNFEDDEHFSESFFALLQRDRKTGGKWVKQLQINSFLSSFSSKH